MQKIFFFSCGVMIYDTKSEYKFTLDDASNSYS